VLEAWLFKIRRGRQQVLALVITYGGIVLASIALVMALVATVAPRSCWRRASP
jgi:hypothetical protein